MSSLVISNDWPVPFRKEVKSDHIYAHESLAKMFGVKDLQLKDVVCLAKRVFGKLCSRYTTDPEIEESMNVSDDTSWVYKFDCATLKFWKNVQRGFGVFETIFLNLC